MIEIWFYTKGESAFPGPVFNSKEQLKEWFKKGFVKGIQYTLRIKQNNNFIDIENL